MKSHTHHDRALEIHLDEKCILTESSSSNNIHEIRKLELVSDRGLGTGVNNQAPDQVISGKVQSTIQI
jgi:hypothetical protein